MSDHDDYGGVKIMRFDGSSEDWYVWSGDILAVLDNRDNLVELIMPGARARPTEGNEAQATWDRMNRKIFSRLKLYTMGTAKSLVLRFAASMDGVAAWNALKEKYELKGQAQKTTLQERLYSDSMDSDEDVDAYIGRIEEMRRTLKELGIDITDAIMLGIVMAKLPPRYHHVRDVLEMTEDLTYDALKERMRVIYRRDLTSGRRPNEVLMTQHRRKCYICGSTDHLKGSCSKKGTGGETRTCYKCGKVGHLKKDCKSEDSANYIITF